MFLKWREKLASLFSIGYVIHTVPSSRPTDVLSGWKVCTSSVSINICTVVHVTPFSFYSSSLSLPLHPRLVSWLHLCTTAQLSNSSPPPQKCPHPRSCSSSISTIHPTIPPSIHPSIHPHPPTRELHRERERELQKERKKAKPNNNDVLHALAIAVAGVQ